MRRLTFVSAAVAGLLAAASFGFLVTGSSPVDAVPIVKDAHVHDDYYHPAGTFIVGPGTDHTLAMASCQVANPDPECDVLITENDSVRWVAPAPLAANLHTVTECTDNTFSTCGAGSASPNPIEDSGVRAQPGWPYQVQFTDPGTFYYRCEVHPATMRGRVIVQALPVGGTVDLGGADDTAARSESGSGGSGDALTYVITAGAAVILLAGAGLFARRRLARRPIRTE